jgi:hypothetical protein
MGAPVVSEQAREFIDFWIENSVHAAEQSGAPGALSAKGQHQKSHEHKQTPDTWAGLVLWLTTLRTGGGPELLSYFFFFFRAA